MNLFIISSRAYSQCSRFLILNSRYAGMLNNHIVDPVSVSISVDEWFNFLVSIRSAQSASNFSFFVFLSAVVVADS